MDQHQRVEGSLALAESDEAPGQARPAGFGHPPRLEARGLPELPPAPAHIEELGLPESFIHDLALKTLYRSTLPTPVGIAQAMHVSPTAAREALDELKRQRLIETTAASGRFESEWQYRLTELGLREAENAFSRSKYVGPMPVPIQEYFRALEVDTEVGAPDPVRLARALQQLVLARETVAKVCLALTSGRPAMLWGAPGNGKTTILELCSEAMQGVTLLPLCVFVSGQIIRIYDDLVHIAIEDDRANEPNNWADRRWILVQRPFVFVGGELRPEDLDLAYDPAVGYHQAPPHVKAHGGLLAIDDFGRQQVSPQQLLNRWIAALERGEDTMSLITGERISFPFRSTICFSTNLDPRAMLEEAHLRRVPYKIRIPEPTREQMGEIFRRFAQALGVQCAPGGIETAVEMARIASQGNPRSCHPRDILQLIAEEARFVKRPPVLDGPAARRACEIYFAFDPGPIANPPPLNSA
jgi:predicted ATPase with chaperone activity